MNMTEQQRKKKRKRRQMVSRVIFTLRDLCTRTGDKDSEELCHMIHRLEHMFRHERSDA